MKTIKKHLISLAITLPLVVSCGTTKKVQTAALVENEKSIVIINDNDVHCNIDGYARMAGLRDAIADTAHVAMVTCGDYLQGGTIGAISHGQYIADIMKSMGYTALGLGNHEFDYQVSRMEELLAFIGTPVVCCNLFDMQQNRVFASYLLKQYGNKKVAFVGVVTPCTIQSEEYAFFDKEGRQHHHLAEKDVYRLVQEATNEARSKGADYVVVVSHLGESPNDLNVDSRGLIKATNGIDVVLDGHTHSTIPCEYIQNKDGKTVLTLQTGTQFANVGKVVFMPDGKKYASLVSLKDFDRENAVVRHVTDSVKTLANALVNRQICTSDYDLRILDEEGRQAVRLRETNAGDIIADAYRIVTGADFAISNGGGIRNEVKAGNLSYGNLVAMLPYDNYVCIVKITGQQLIDLLAKNTSSLPIEDGDFPQVSGMKFTVNTSSTTDRITDLTILDKATGKYVPVDVNREYNLATIDYCITGGGLRGMLKKNTILKQDIIIYSECLIEYITKHLNGHIGKEYAEPQGRITIK